MSREQWGHGYHTGIKAAQKSNLVRAMVEKHRTDCLCIVCRNYPCGIRCDEESCVVDCVFYLKEA